SWLFTAALNKIRDRDRFYKQEKRDLGRELEPEVSGEQHLLQGYASVCTPSHQVSAAEQIAILEQAMDELEPDHRDVIAYARLAGMSAKEIAPLMNRNETAVYALLGRALLKLAEQLKSHGMRPPGETL
ncbi:MAG: RNA polymerase sigma factor, partial [Planctomycetota bacterium]